MTNSQTTSLERIVRQRPLTDAEAAKYNKVRKQVKKDLPELVLRNKLNQDVMKRLGLQTLETRGRDSLDFHDISVEGIKDVIQMAYEAGRVSKPTPKKKRSGKRFHLLHVYGSVDPSILGKSHKTYESLLKAAKKFFKSDDFTEGEDGLFYTVTTGNSVRVSPFDSSDLEDEDGGEN